MTNWDDLKIFLAVAEAPSMRMAAKQLKISHSTVSRRIEALEASLRIRLFERKPSGYVLTESGAELMPIALALDDKLNGFERAVAGRDDALEGDVCVTLPDAVAIHFFMPYFVEFMERFPKIRLQIEDSFDLFDLSRREADVAIRFTNNPPDYLIGRKLGAMHQAVFATKEYLAKHDPSAPDSTARWVGWGQPSNKPFWIESSPFPHLEVCGNFDNVLIQLSAIKHGAGLGYIPCFLGQQDADLVQIGPPSEKGIEVWMLSHRDLRAAARMRVFRQFLADRAEEISEGLSGCVAEK